jgi:hypothetical protein
MRWPQLTSAANSSRSVGVSTPSELRSINHVIRASVSGGKLRSATSSRTAVGDSLSGATKGDAAHFRGGNELRPLLSHVGCVVERTQGALRDPGLCCRTASR